MHHPPAAHVDRLNILDVKTGRFPQDRCDALFAAILIDDEVDEDARLPGDIRLDYTREELDACFKLCRQLWRSGFDRGHLAALSEKLIRRRDLEDADRLQFKHVRAKFKHFRYAHALYGRAHRYPRLLDRITITMGHLQDAYRNGRRQVVLREALLLRLLLTRPPLHLLYAETEAIDLATPQSFRSLLEQDVATMTAMLAGDKTTGRRFHLTRKVIGRQVSFWDTLRTISPSADRYDMSRSLSAINGLMGDLHDRMVERRALDPATYDAAFALPDEIRSRIAALIPAYAINTAGSEKRMPQDAQTADETTRSAGLRGL